MEKKSYDKAAMAGSVRLEVTPVNHPPHLPTAQAVAGGSRVSQVLPAPVRSLSALWAGLLEGRVALVGRFETADGFRDACELYSSQGYFVGTTRKAVVQLIEQAKRRAAA